MNIGIFTDTYFPQVNGVTYTLELWKQKLEEKQHNVKIFYPATKYKPKENEFPFRSIEFVFYKGYKIGLPLRLMKNASDLDIVHIHGLFTMALAGFYAARRNKIPKILTYHTPADEYVRYISKKPLVQKALKGICNKWERRILNSCNLVTVPSNEIKMMLQRKKIKEPFVLSNGLDIDLFRQVDYANFRKKHKIPEGRVIGFCGRLGYEKHLEDLIGLSNSFDGVILIAGRGPAEKYYRDMIKGRKNVKMLGFIPRERLSAFYSNLDVFVFPSTAETQGLVALESMACSTPVVGAYAMALKDTIINDKTGYHYEQGNLEELKGKINLAYKNRKKLSKDCFKYAEKHSVDNTINEVIKIYEKLV